MLYSFLESKQVFEFVFKWGLILMFFSILPLFGLFSSPNIYQGLCLSLNHNLFISSIPYLHIHLSIYLLIHHSLFVSTWSTGSLSMVQSVNKLFFLWVYLYIFLQAHGQDSLQMITYHKGQNLIFMLQKPLFMLSAPYTITHTNSFPILWSQISLVGTACWLSSNYGNKILYISLSHTG